MKIIYNKFIPFKGFLAMNLFGVLFVRKRGDGSNPALSRTTLTHESIHTEQMKELLYIGFYILYFIEWVIRLFTNTSEAYRSISFEREAYANQHSVYYIGNRKRYSWINYITKK